MICRRCDKPLTGKQTVYCSKHCCKLFLKKLYRQRSKEKINAYRRAYEKRGVRNAGNSWKWHQKDHLKSQPVCQKCGTDKDLQVCHIKPRHKGGRHHRNLITLCRTHHHHFDKKLSTFW